MSREDSDLLGDGNYEQIMYDYMDDEEYLNASAGLDDSSDALNPLEAPSININGVSV